jgi:polygalacturonase
MQNVGQAFLFTYDYAAGTGGDLPIIANVTIDNVIASATKSQGAIVGLATSLMGVPTVGNKGIQMTNTHISGGNGFTVNYGELQVGKSSVVTTAAGTDGQILPIQDSGATTICPATIVIPTQL